MSQQKGGGVVLCDDFVPVSFCITSMKDGWLFAELVLDDLPIRLANSYLGGLDCRGC